MVTHVARIADVEPTKSIKKRIPYFMQLYLIFGACFGVCPYWMNTNNVRQTVAYKIPYYFTTMMTILYDIFTAISIVTGVAWASSNNQIDAYIAACHQFSNLLLTFALYCTMKYKFKKIEVAMDVFQRSYYGRNAQHYQEALIAVAVFLSSLVSCIIRIAFEYKDDPKEFLVYLANAIRRTVFLPDVYEEKISSCTIFLGILGSIVVFFGRMVEEMSKDAVLFVAITLSRACDNFHFKRIKPLNFEIGEIIMDTYAELKQISKTINSAFKLLIWSVFLNYLFFFAFAADAYFDDSYSKVTKFTWILETFKAVLIFYFGIRTGKTSERFREWLKEYPNNLYCSVEKVDIIIEEQSAKSIGLGSGALYINDSFLLGFVGVVAAYFFGIVETRKRED